MSMALMLALFLPAMQEDPQVAYREGLFEEVDQGNLEKAAALYAKVLKSGAPETLKAKALLRTGFCHEKKGRRKEAEQAWRDVIERFPGAAETVKQARERLDSLARPQGEAAQNMESMIQSLILDLGGEEPARKEAISKLKLISDPAVPFLRKALHHKDGRLAVGAARVLSELELKEGLYEPLIAAFNRYGQPTIFDAGALSDVLFEREELREKFVKDSERVANTQLIGKMAGSLNARQHPEFPKLVENWLANPKLGVDAYTWDQAARYWVQNNSEPDVVRLIGRLGEAKNPQSTKLLALMRVFQSQKPAGQATTDALLAALKALPNPGEILSEFSRQWWFVEVLDPEKLFSGPVRTWFSKAEPDLRRNILSQVRATAGGGGRPPLAEAIRRFLLAVLGDASESWETRSAAASVFWDQGFRPGNPEESAQVVAYGLDALKEYESRPEMNPASRRVIFQLQEVIPVDSKELPALLDRTFDLWHESERTAFTPRASRQQIVAASFRAVRRRSPGLHLALRLLKEQGTPEEQIEMGPELAALAKDNDRHKALDSAVPVYTLGLSKLEGKAFEDAWKTFRQLFDEASPDLKATIARHLIGLTQPPVGDFMKESLKSEHAKVRYAAIMYLGSSKDPATVPLLIDALEDASETNQIAAIQGLSEKRALDAVPALIRFLDSPSDPLRSVALGALQGIRSHYEAKTQWRRWYDETRKLLEK